MRVTALRISSCIAPPAAHKLVLAAPPGGEADRDVTPARHAPGGARGGAPAQPRGAAAGSRERDGLERPGVATEEDPPERRSSSSPSTIRICSTVEGSFVQL